MNSILDSREKIKTLDLSNMLSSIEALPNQIKDAWIEASKVVVPESYRRVKNVVMVGIGGSALAGYVIKELYKKELHIPFSIVPHYELPGYADSDSLIILSSYSGTTEEILTASKEAHTLGAKILVICAGGALADFAHKHNYPIYLIDPKFNPCGQPRMAIGYAIVGQIALLNTVGVIKVQETIIDKIVAGLNSLQTKLNPESVDGNLAKYMAFSAYDKHIVFVGAEHLTGAVHVTNNQANENAKVLTSEWSIPEFNHHYMEALRFPNQSRDNTIFFLYNSAIYHERVVKRFPITRQIIENAGFECQLIQATAPTPLEQVFEIIQVGEYMVLYLAILYGIDPTPIPHVESFKLALT